MKLHLLWLALLLATGCATHIAPYKPKVRKFDPGVYAAAPRPVGASLYAEGGRGLFEDDRASRVGDVLIIRIDESDSGSREATSNLAKKNDIEHGAPATMGLLPALAKAYPGLDPAQLLSISSSSSFKGNGQIERSGRVRGTLPVRVRQVTPNGDLYVEGSKVVLVGQEEHHLYLSGIVRAADVRPDNSVFSSQVADAEIEYTGRGDVSNQQRPGWGARLLSVIWPF